MSGSEPLLLAVDQGTSGTTCLAVSAQGAVRARTHRDVAVAYPRDGWAEQDANELWRSVQDAVAELAGGLDAAPVALGNSRPPTNFKPMFCNSGILRSVPSRFESHCVI